MKWLLNSLRAIIIAGSLSGFLGSWALFAHAGKPAPINANANTSTVPALSTPAPLPSLPSLAPESRSPSALQPLPALPSFPSRSRFLPRLRTSGS